MTHWDDGNNGIKVLAFSGAPAATCCHKTFNRSALLTLVQVAQTYSFHKNTSYLLGANKQPEN